MSELKAIELECNMGKDINGVEHREPWKAYDIDEVDALIAKKDAEIAQLQAMLEERNLQIGNLDAAAKRNKRAAQTLRKKMNHQKYKRCLAMAEMCDARYDEEDAKVNGHYSSWEYISPEMKYWERWRERWEALAEKFKEAE